MKRYVFSVAGLMTAATMMSATTYADANVSSEMVENVAENMVETSTGNTSVNTNENTVKGAEKVSLMPNFHGAVRPRWEIDTKSGDSRFEVRWARFTVDGKVAPSLGYFIQVDFCDQGVIKIKDAYAKLNLAKDLTLQAGQFRMPFGTEPFMSPQTYIFANRSFMGKQMCNFRKVGAKLTYNLPISLPLTVEAGVFNAGGIGNHNTWSKSYAGSGRATLTLGDFKLCGGVMDILPDKTRIMLYDMGVSWNHGNWRAAAEYMNEHYNGTDRADSHSWCVWGDYGRDAKLGIFNRWSVQARYDGMNRHWNGVEGNADDPGRHRITVGGTLTYRYKKVFCDLMLDYEKYCYFHNYEAPTGQSDKVVVELAVRF